VSRLLLLFNLIQLVGIVSLLIGFNERAVIALQNILAKRILQFVGDVAPEIVMEVNAAG